MPSRLAGKMTDLVMHRYIFQEFVRHIESELQWERFVYVMMSKDGKVQTVVFTEDNYGGYKATTHDRTFPAKTVAQLVKILVGQGYQPLGGKETPEQTDYARQMLGHLIKKGLSNGDGEFTMWISKGYEEARLSVWDYDKVRGVVGQIDDRTFQGVDAEDLAYQLYRAGYYLDTVNLYRG